MINSIVDQIFMGKSTVLMDDILRISEWQLRLFQHLRGKQMLVFAWQGIDSGEFAIKLCGSGGGGFYLKLQAGQA